MAANRIVVGLDIGTTKISAIVGRRNEFGKLEILGLGRAESTGVARGVVTNVMLTVQAIKAAVADAENQSGYKINEVYVGIAGQHIRSDEKIANTIRKNAEEEITRSDIDGLIEDMHHLAIPAGQKLIHVIPQEFKIDSESGIKHPIGMAGSQLEGKFHLITGQMCSIRTIYRCVEQAGLKVKDLILEPIASAASVLSQEEKEAGVALVDIGGGTTDIAIFQDNTIWHTAVIPFGGKSITNDIREGCRIMENQAELLKVKYGCAMPLETQENKVITIPGLRGREPKEISVRTLAYIIRARIDEIIGQVEYQINRKGFGKDKLIGGIVITGGGAQLNYLKQLVEYETGFEARIGYPTEHLGRTPFTQAGNPMHATGIGLVLNGLDDLDAEASYTEQSELATEVAKEPIGAPINGANEIEEEMVAEPRKPINIFNTLRSKIVHLFEPEDDKQFE